MDDADLIAAAADARSRAHVPHSRFAMGAAVATGAGRPVALALVAPRTDGELTHPCGACLQVALELGGAELRVLVADPNGAGATSDVATLLPAGPRKRRA